MAYRFRGVPKAFQTRDQALAFLRNSPGYVKRQSSYLQTYWPGLAAELGPAQAPTTVRAKQDAEIWSAPRSIFVPPAFTDAGGSGAGPVSPTGTTPTPAEVRRAALKQARDRRRFSLGLPITTPLAPNIADAVPTYRTPQQQRALDLLAHPPGTIVGEALRNWKKNVIRQSGLTPTEQQQMLHEVDQWYATPGANLVDVAKGIGKAAWHANDVVQRAAYGDPNAQEAVLNNTIGKGLTNLLQGQGPKNARDVAGLLLGAAMLPLPYGKAGKAAIGAARAASEVGGSWARTGEPFVREVVHVTTPEQASAIRASGFKVGVGEGFGRNPDYGQGVYLSDKESDMASYWRHQLATKNEEGIVPTDTVSGTVSLQNPYAYDYIRYDRVGAHISPRESLAAQRPDLLPRYDELVAQTGSTASGEKQAFGAVLRESGYDGIVVNHPAGEEIVAFDPAAVKIDTRATNITPPGKVKPNDWGADDPRRVNRLDRIIWKQRPPAAPSPYDAERNALISALRESHGSRSNALPARMRGPQAIQVFRLINRLADMGERGRFWYSESARGILDLVGGDKEMARKFAALIAIYSPQRAVVPNMGMAKSAYKEFIDTGNITMGTGPQIEKAMNVMAHGDTAWEGRKTANFYSNLLKYIDPEQFARDGFVGDEVTADMWMSRMFGYKTDTVSDGRYDVIQSVVRQIAKEKGWTPDEVQAATWTAIKELDPWDVSANVDFTGAIGRNTSTINLETTRGISGIGADLTHEETLAVNRELEPLIVSLADRLGITIRNKAAPAGIEAIREGRSAYQAARNASLHFDVFERPEVVRRLTNILARAFDQYEVWAIKPGAYVGGKLRPALHFTAPELDNPEVADKFFAYLNEKYPKKMQGFMPYRDGGGITIVSNGSQTNATLPKWANSFANDIAAAADAAGINHVDFEAENLGLIIGEGAPSGDSQVLGSAGKLAGRTLDDQLAAEGRDALNAAVERVRAARGQGLGSEAGQLTPGAFAERAPAGSRTLTVNDLTQQVGSRARSRVTQAWIENPADRLSLAMMADNRLAAIARRIMPTASAEARVSRYAGRQQMIEASRSWGAMQRYERALPKEGSPEDIAHYWWAQLPPQMRDVSGLKAVRAKQAQNLEELTSGRALEKLQAQEEAVRAQIGSWAGDGAPHALMEELQSIKLDIADIPIKIEDLSTALARLDEVIANPPKLDSKVIEAVARFSEERQRILQEAGVLKAENAGPRRGLVANWLGVDPTGAEVYVGHRMGKTRGARASLLPGGVGTGRPTTPQGARSMNRLVLADTGRLRDSTRVAVDDWQAAQVYRSALQSRNDLGKLGRAFDGRLGPNEYLINPRGRPVPPQWKRDRLAEIADQGYDEEQIRQAAQDIVDTYMADPAHAQQMLADARDQGVQWNELRVIDAKTADRYFSHAGVKKPPRSGAIGTAYDTAVDAAVASIIFARIGYIPKNVVANLIMGVPHQGVYLFANVPRAMQVLTDADLLPRLAAEVGESGPTVALGNEAAIAKAKGIPSKIAHAVSNVADNPLRISAFLHEAAAEGVISKTSPILNATDRQALLDLLDDPAKRPLLNDIRARSVEAMADFSRMTPTQRKYARRFLVIPGWLWAGSRYPFHFVATHPGRSLAIGYVAAGEPGSPVQTNKPITDYMAQGVANFNAGFDLGGKKVLRTGAISPVSTPWEVAQAVAQRDGRTIGDYTNPFAASVWNVAHSQLDSPTGPYRTSFGKSVVGNTTRLVPGYSLGKNLISPPDKPRYFPEDTSRLGRLKREVGVIPIQVNKTASGTRPKAYQRVFKERQQVFDAAAKLYGITELPPALKHAYNVKARVEAARAVAEKEFPNGGVDYARAAYLEEAKVAVSLGLAKQSDLDHLRSALASASQGDIEKWRRSLQQTLWEDAYLKPIREARAVLKEKGVELTHG